MEDKLLVRDFLNTKSEQAFLKLYRSKTPHLYKMALRLTQDELQSEDLIQEMWIVAIRKLDSFQWKSELKTWLIGIMINLFRSQRKQQEEAMATIEHAPEVAVSFELPLVTATDLERAISQLPAGYRQIILLHDLEGYKHREIAELLDITEGTSKSQLFHARKTLRTYLEEDIEKGKKL